VKEGKNRRKIAFRAVVVGGVLISAAAVALYTPWLGLFGLRTITVLGNQRVSAETIGLAAGLSRGRPLLTIHRSDVAERVCGIPWVRSARISRVLPDTLRIDVEERVPVARALLSDGACMVLGDGGVVVEGSCAEGAPELEVVGAELTDLSPGGHLIEASISDLLDLLRRSALSDMHIRRIDVTDLSAVVLDAESGLRILLGAIDSHAQRLARLVVLSREMDLSAYRQIDLRLEGEATLVTW